MSLKFEGLWRYARRDALRNDAALAQGNFERLDWRRHTDAATVSTEILFPRAMRPSPSPRTAGAAKRGVIARTISGTQRSSPVGKRRTSTGLDLIRLLDVMGAH